MKAKENGWKISQILAAKALAMTIVTLTAIAQGGGGRNALKRRPKGGKAHNMDVLMTWEQKRDVVIPIQTLDLKEDNIIRRMAISRKSVKGIRRDLEVLFLVVAIYWHSLVTLLVKTNAKGKRESVIQKVYDQGKLILMKMSQFLA